MPKIRYRTTALRPSSLEIVQRANIIIEDWRDQGYDLTLRQLYYQFVSRGWIDNKDTEYKRLGSIINDARYAGLVDWNSITDRTRNLRGRPHWDDPADIVRSAAIGYNIDKWATQPYRPEVWVEKDALVGIVGQACDPLDVPYFSCRGYTSASEVWVAARRLQSYRDNDQSPVIFHLGDHDPSGVDMSRDIEDRITEFMGWGLEFHRIALTMDQIEEHAPPPNPAKLTDSRCGAYIEKYGDESWELDALPPSVMSSLISRHIEGVRDESAWQDAIEREEDERDTLTAAADRWEEVKEFLNA